MRRCTSAKEIDPLPKREVGSPLHASTRLPQLMCWLGLGSGLGLGLANPNPNLNPNPNPNHDGEEPVRPLPVHLGEGGQRAQAEAQRAARVPRHAHAA